MCGNVHSISHRRRRCADDAHLLAADPLFVARITTTAAMDLAPSGFDLLAIIAFPATIPAIAF